MLVAVYVLLGLVVFGMFSSDLVVALGAGQEIDGQSLLHPPLGEQLGL